MGSSRRPPLRWRLKLGSRASLRPGGSGTQGLHSAPGRKQVRPAFEERGGKARWHRRGDRSEVRANFNPGSRVTAHEDLQVAPGLGI